MKTTIRGVRYDTEAATEIGRAEHGNGSEQHHWTAALYKSPRSGRYFLAGSGGPMTRFADPAGGWMQGERIIPMTDAQAEAWAQDYLPESDTGAI